MSVVLLSTAPVLPAVVPDVVLPTSPLLPVALASLLPVGVSVVVGVVGLVEVDITACVVPSIVPTPGPKLTSVSSVPDPQAVATASHAAAHCTEDKDRMPATIPEPCAGLHVSLAGAFDRP
ncbi:hypothetical protein [Nannocystis sp.]|uniref:hypothetical protein n=1 Tax=Nannocystis sp. TaxID=1962667 RepID=UPI002420B39D|nr:hypothetical protein [Nannocystis sp.]MBK7826582.1 hypothetical protein [Nannocystis sp.]MBK9754203.1 hypothetical protein [Nannocystis sp.]